MMRCVRWPASCGARCSASRNSRQGCALHRIGSAGRWPATSTATATAGFLWDGGVAWPALGRCRPWSTGGSTPRVDAFRDIRFPMEIHPRMAWIYWSPGTFRRRGGVGLRGIRAMDGAAEPTGVRALCLRSTASQAPERTAASGWAGPRRGTCGVPAIRHRTALPRHAAVALAVAVEVAGQRPALPGATGHGPAATASDRRPPRVARPALRPPPPGHGRHAPPRR